MKKEIEKLSDDSTILLRRYVKNGLPLCVAIAMASDFAVKVYRQVKVEDEIRFNNVMEKNLKKEPIDDKKT